MVDVFVPCPNDSMAAIYGHLMVRGIRLGALDAIMRLLEDHELVQASKDMHEDWVSVWATDRNGYEEFHRIGPDGQDALVLAQVA